jgi:hypothetical protein
MFFPGSRYKESAIYLVPRPPGTPVATVVVPLPSRRRLLGFHPRKQGQRLDHLASRYLGDPTASWLLCDANNSPVPDALARRDLVAIPAKP